MPVLDSVVMDVVKVIWAGFEFVGIRELYLIQWKSTIYGSSTRVFAVLSAQKGQQF